MNCRFICPFDGFIVCAPSVVLKGNRIERPTFLQKKKTFYSKLFVEFSLYIYLNRRSKFETLQNFFNFNKSFVLASHISIVDYADRRRTTRYVHVVI